MSHRCARCHIRPGCSLWPGAAAARSLYTYVLPPKILLPNGRPGTAAVKSHDHNFVSYLMTARHDSQRCSQLTHQRRTIPTVCQQVTVALASRWRHGAKVTMGQISQALGDGTRPL